MSRKRRIRVRKRGGGTEDFKIDKFRSSLLRSGADPGMTATILFELERATDALLIPNGALRFDPERKPEMVNWRPGKGRPMQPRVFKLAGESLVEITVELGISDGSFTQLKAGDLSAGDVVVIGWDLSRQRPRGRRTSFF